MHRKELASRWVGLLCVWLVFVLGPTFAAVAAAPFTAVPATGNPAPIVVYHDPATGAGFNLADVLSDSPYYGNYMVWDGAHIARGKLRDTIQYYLQDGIARMTGKTPALINSSHLVSQEGIIVTLYRHAPASITTDAAVKAALGYAGTNKPDCVADREAYCIRSESNRVWIVANTVDGLMSAAPDLLAAVGYEVLGMGPNWVDAPDYTGRDLVFNLQVSGRATGYYYRMIGIDGAGDGRGTLSESFQLTPPDEMVYRSYARWRVGARLCAGQSVPGFPGHALDSYHPQILQIMRDHDYTDGYLSAGTTVGPSISRPPAGPANKDHLWINTDDSGVCWSDGVQWKTHPGATGFKLDLSTEWVRQWLLNDMITKSTRAFWDAPDDWFVYPTEPDDGDGGDSRFAERVHHPNWYADYRKQEGLPFAAYALHGYRGITQTIEFFTNTVADTVFAFNNWLLREYDQWVDTLTAGPQTDPRIPTRLTRTGKDRKAMIRCSLYSYNYHDVPPHFNLDHRIRLQVGGFAKQRGAGEWRTLAAREDIAGAFHILLPDEPIGNYAYLSDVGWSSDGKSPGKVARVLPAWGSSAQAIADIFDPLTRSGVRSYFAETKGCGFGRHGLGLYLIGKHLWRPLTIAQLDAVRDQWFQRAFGPGWRKLKEYYDVIEPAYSVDGPNFWARAIKLMGEADTLIPDDSPYQKRLDDLKQHWYFYYLLDTGQVIATNRATQELLWKGQTAYMAPQSLFCRWVFGQRYLHDVPQISPYTNGPAHYTPVETAAWWSNVTRHWPYTPVHRFRDGVLANGTPARAADLNDLVSVKKFQTYENERGQTLSYDSCSRAPVPFYTVARRAGVAIGCKLVWPARDHAPKYYGPHAVNYTLDRWDPRRQQWVAVTNGVKASVLVDKTKVWSGENAWLVELRRPAPVAGTYRLTVGRGGAFAQLGGLQWDISKWPGPLADDTGPTFSQIQTFDGQYDNGGMYVYLPKGTSSLDLEVGITDASVKTVTLYQSFPLTATTAQRTVDISAPGAHVIPLQRGEAGNIAKLQLGNNFHIPYLYSIPRLWSRSPSALLVPRAIAEADKLTIMK